MMMLTADATTNNIRLAFKVSLLDTSCQFHPKTITLQLNSLRPRIYTSINWAIIGSDDSLSTVRRQAIIWTNAVLLLFGPLETTFIEISTTIEQFSYKKFGLKMSSTKWWPVCLCLSVLRHWQHLVSRYSFLLSSLFRRDVASILFVITGIIYIDGLVQDCSNSSALAMELLLSCTKSST